MELLEAFDLTKSYRAAAQLCGVDHHTVKRVVAARAMGYTTNVVRTTVARPFTDKIEELVERSSGKIRADVVHQRLAAMGYTGSERTTRRVVAMIKAEFRHQTHRIYRPWIPEPGLWLQYDCGTGPQIDGLKTILFCAWLAWSRFRVIVTLADRTMASVIVASFAELETACAAQMDKLNHRVHTVTRRVPAPTTLCAQTR